MIITYPDLCDDNSVMQYINKYGRLHGWYLANKFNLPTQKKCGILINEQEMANIREDEILYCRADMPWGRGNKLLRSQDIHGSELKEFFKSVKKLSSEAIIITFTHPSIWLTNRYLPRYKTSGAAQILFGDNGQIILEMVGAGYDCGDISRGKTVHQRIIIEGEGSHFNYFNMISHRSLPLYQVGNQEYQDSRDRRIGELISFYGDDFSSDIEACIPKTLSDMTEQYEIIKKTCISKVINVNEIWDNYVVMLNLYDNKPYVYEVWQPKRSVMQ